MPHCVSCQLDHPRSSFSKNQLSKPAGRCASCVGGGGGGGGGGRPAVQQRGQKRNAARTNSATAASFSNYDLGHPFAEGAFRWVAKGHYTQGNRAGEACVCKWFKSGQVYEETFFAEDVIVSGKAIDIVQKWNDLNLIDRAVRLNLPEVWTFTSSSGEWSDRKCLQEPFIDNWEKFNSNSGWVGDSTNWSDCMQALSHFSYHYTSGQCVLCDLQGGIYADGAVLTDPVILSRNREYGVTDLGQAGISTFFSTHVCNEYCKASWNKPADQQRYLPVQAGTSMAMAPGHLPTRSSRPAMTMAPPPGGGYGTGHTGYTDSDSSSSDGYY